MAYRILSPTMSMTTTVVGPMHCLKSTALSIWSILFGGAVLAMSPMHTELLWCQKAVHSPSTHCSIKRWIDAKITCRVLSGWAAFCFAMFPPLRRACYWKPKTNHWGWQKAITHCLLLHFLSSRCNCHFKTPAITRCAGSSVFPSRWGRCCCASFISPCGNITRFEAQTPLA